MTDMVVANGNAPKKDDGIPILIPEESILEGFIKTRKSFKIESYFYGTLLSAQKVIIDVRSNVAGDIVCAELVISGTFEGNIFCTGKVECNGNAKITGKVFTKLFQNEDSCDLNCIIQVPNNEVIKSIRELLVNINSETKLSTDTTLDKIRDLFVENVYSHTKSPNNTKNNLVTADIPGNKLKQTEDKN